MYNKLFIIKITSGSYNVSQKKIYLNWNNIIEEHSFTVPQTNNNDNNIKYRSILREFIKIYKGYINGSKGEIKHLNLEFKIQDIIHIGNELVISISDFEVSCNHYPVTGNICLNNESLNIYIDSLNKYCDEVDNDPCNKFEGYICNDTFNNYFYDKVNRKHMYNSDYPKYNSNMCNCNLCAKPHNYKLHPQICNPSNNTNICHSKTPYMNKNPHSYRKPQHNVYMYSNQHVYKDLYKEAHHNINHNSHPDHNPHLNHNQHQHSNPDCNPHQHSNHNPHQHSNPDYNSHQHSNHNSHQHSNPDYNSHQHSNHNSHKYSNHNSHQHADCHESEDENPICDQHPYNIYNNTYSVGNNNINSSVSCVIEYHSFHDMYKKYKSRDVCELKFKSKKRLNVGILIPLSGNLYNEGQFANKGLKFLKNEINGIIKKVEFNFSINDLQSEELILKTIKELHRNEKIEIFICGPIDNNKIKALDVYIKANNLLLLTFGYSLKHNFISENIISLSPVIDIQARAISSYIEYSNKSLKKYIIPCYINNIYGTCLFNSVKDRLGNMANISIETPVTYNLSIMDLNKMYDELKYNIQKLLNNQISGKQIYLYFISSYEIINFIIHVLVNDEDKIFENINWVGTDSNNIIFNQYLKELYYDKFNINNINISLERVKQFLAKVKFICLTHHYDDSDDNNKILDLIGYNSFTLEMFDCFWLLANSFMITQSNNKNKLRNAIKEISKCQYGLTGNLSLDNNGKRQYSKYCIRRAEIHIEDFVWNKIGTYDIQNGLIID